VRGTRRIAVLGNSMDQQYSDSSLSWVAQQVLLLLADSRTGATSTQLSGQLFMPKDQVDSALRELLTHGYATRSGRRWRPVIAMISPSQQHHLRSA
jgi:DNA-binding IclR family transcriptional regulator